MAVKKPEPAKQKKAKDLEVGKTKAAEKVKGGMTKADTTAARGRLARRSL